MTRRQRRINHTAIEYSEKTDLNIAADELARLSFIAGAEWADRNNDKERWISVKERLPEEGIYVATLDNGGRNDIRHFYCGKWYGRFGNEYRGITHWLPLPAPQKKGGEK